MSAPNPSRLDANQVLQGAFDEESGRLRTDSEATIVNADIDVALDASEDNVAIRDSDGDELEIEADGSINVNNITGTVSLPTGASTAALQTTGNTTLSSINTSLNDIETRLETFSVDNGPTDGNTLRTASNLQVNNSDVTNLNPVPTTAVGTLSTVNSTTTNLLAGQTFTGMGEDVLDFGSISISITASHPSANLGLKFQTSEDNINWYNSDTYNYISGIQTYSLAPVSRYFRLQYINGSTATSMLAIQVIYRQFYVKPSSHRIGDVINSENDAELTKSVLTAQKPDGDFTPIDATTAGNLKISTEEFDDNALDWQIGNANDRTQRVVIASDQPTLTSKITDVESLRDVSVGPFRELKTAEWTRLVGGNATSTVVNTRLWSTTGSTGSGTTTSADGLFVVSTGTTANSSAIFTSTEVARYISTSANAYVIGGRLPDGGTVNNIRKWGAFTATDGVYFKMNGTSFQVCRIQNGVETAVSAASFNGSQPVIDTNFHTYEIHYVAGSAAFYQDRKRLHTISTPTSSLASTMHFPIRTENININGQTANLLFQIRGNGIHRFGRPLSRPRFDFINTASTVVLKREPGTLHTLYVNRSSVGGTSTITLYDNTSASGTIIAVMTLDGVENTSIDFELDFNIGLTVVSDSASVQYTIVWE